MIVNMFSARRGNAIITFLLMALCCLVSVTSCEKSDARDYYPLVSTASRQSVSRNMTAADSLRARGDLEEALVYYMVVCHRADDGLSDDDLQKCGLAHLEVGKIYYEKRNYAQALEYYINGLKIYERSAEQPTIARFYNNIGTIYNIFKDYERGMSYYRKGYALTMENGDRKTRYDLLANMTNLSLLQDSVANARRYWKMSESLRDTTDADNNFVSRFNKMSISIAGKDYAGAARTARECIAYASALGLKPEYEAYTCEYMYDIHSKLGNRDSAMYYLDRAYRSSIENNLPNLTVAILQEYGDIYERSGDIRKALDCRTRYIAMRDSIYNFRDFDVVKNEQFLYEMDKTNRQIEDLNERDRSQKSIITRQRLIIIGFILLALLIFGLLVVVYRQKRNLDRSYRSLYEVNRKSVDTQERMRERLHKANAQLEELRSGQAAVTLTDAGQAVEDAPSAGTDANLSIGGNADGGCSGTPAPSRRMRKSNLREELRPNLLEAIRNVMENTLEYTDRDFSLGRLAQLVDSNSKYVSEVINDTYEKNFSNFVNEYRIHLACLRLADDGEYSRYTVKAIGESVGFNSNSTFMSVFRRHTGLTPSMYQSKIREEREAQKRG